MVNWTVETLDAFDVVFSVLIASSEYLLEFVYDVILLNFVFPLFTFLSSVFSVFIWTANCPSTLVNEMIHFLILQIQQQRSMNVMSDAIDERKTESNFEWREGEKC